MQGDYRRFEPQGIEDSLVFKIALGVFIGTLAASLVVWGAFELRLRSEMHSVEQAVKTQARHIQRQAEQGRIDDQARMIADQERQQRERLQRAEAQRINEESKRAALAAADEREASWKRFYKPSPACAAAGQSVECSNEFIRAKRAFDAQYPPLLR